MPDAALGGLEPNGHAGPHPVDRLVGLDADHRVVWTGHSRIGDRRGAAGLDARVRSLDVRVRADTAVTRPSSQRESATFSLVASAWTSTRITGVCSRASSTSASITSNSRDGGVEEERAHAR